MTRILVVEDNEDFAFGLRKNLEIEGYEVTVAADGAEGVAQVRASSPELVIVDLMLPGLDGLQVIRSLRETGFVRPIMVLSARRQEADKVRSLRFGADDYVTKPFGVLEFLARVEALLRRADQGGPAPRKQAVETFGEIEVDPASRMVLLRGRAISLTPMEFDLLLALLRRRGSVASRLELMKEVWGHQSAVVSRTVDTHIAELRRKLENDPVNPQHILTVQRAGYRLQP